MTQTDHTAAADRPTVGASVLKVEEIGVSFAGVVALRDVSLEVARGEVLGLIGPNGAGKTTLFDVVSGLREPKRGTIIFDGNDVTGRSAVWRSRAGMRRTFQRQQVFGRLTVEENLLCALEWRGGGGGILADLVALPPRRRIERRRRAELDQHVERCGLGPVRHAVAGSLPIGTARMVELGRALAESPSLLLLDEPTSGLGDAEVECLSTVINQLRADGSCGVLLVEHDISFVMSHCDRIVVLQRGEVLAEGIPDAIQANPEVRDAYLG
ncbi:MAG TPA: ABC transporter ATP-binding protein [Acidimicrobiales bacterium]|jgi:branched-chain amino acid transport system ATP-binding protein|nr:ABC transporter ATP-binding protein [Acidimicrobiales bacterium]